MQCDKEAGIVVMQSEDEESKRDIRERLKGPVHQEETIILKVNGSNN